MRSVRTSSLWPSAWLVIGVAALVGVAPPALADSSSPTAPTFTDDGSAGSGQIGNFSYSYGETPNSVVSNASIIGIANRYKADDGYWEAATDGGVFAFGSATFHGSAAGDNLAAPIVGISATDTDGGYWLVGADGGVFNYGDAGYFGNVTGVSGRAATIALVQDDLCGYQEINADGGVFTFGCAPYYGSLPGIGVNELDVIGAVTYGGTGYCTGEADGYVHCWDSTHQGTNDITYHPDSVSSIYTNPVVAIMFDAAQTGGWLVDREGYTYPWGSAAGNCGLHNCGINAFPWGPITSGAGWGSNSSYRFVGADGGTFNFNIPSEGNASVSSELSTSAAKGYGQATLPQGNWGKSYYWQSGTYVDGHNMGLLDLWNTESIGWEWNVCPGNHYPNCNYNFAYGIAQSDPATKYCSEGPPCPTSTAYQTNAWTQMMWGFWYIAAVYGNPVAADTHEWSCGSPPCGYVPVG